MDIEFWAAVAGIATFLLVALTKVAHWYSKRNIYTEKDKEVTLRWLEQSSLKQIWENEGYHLAWPWLKEIEIKKSEGWEVMHEVNEKDRIKYRFVVINNPDHILMGKKNT